MVQVKSFLLRASGSFLLLFFGLSARAQDVRVNCSQVSACTLTPAGGLPWSQANNVWVFKPMNPRVSVYIFIRNYNTTSAHTSQSVQVFQTPFSQDLAPTLSSNSSRWTQDSLVQNTTTNASCNAVAAANDSSPGASGMGTCYVTTMFAAQVAIKITGAATQAGAPDNFDLAIVQETGAPAGQTPGSSGSTNQIVSGIIQPTGNVINQVHTSLANAANTLTISAQNSGPNGQAYLFSIGVFASAQPAAGTCFVIVQDSFSQTLWQSDAQTFIGTSMKTATWIPALFSTNGGSVGSFRSLLIQVTACGSGITTTLVIQGTGT